MSGNCSENLVQSHEIVRKAKSIILKANKNELTLFSLRNLPYKVCYYQEDLLYQSICSYISKKVLLASAAMFSNQIRLPAFFSKCASRKHFDNPTSTFIYRLDIPASTFYSTPPNSGILLTLRSTIGCCSCLHATTSSLSSPIHHLFQNLSRNVNTFIVQTPDGHDQDREIIGSSVVNTSWRPANER